MRSGVFVTGTDTGVGKTLAAAAIVRALVAQQVPVRPMKPIAAGAKRREGRYINADTAELLRASGDDELRAEDVTPVLLREPMAPHVAARRERRRITLQPVLAAFRRARRKNRFVVVEGVGGFMVPLSDDLDTVDLARALALPVVLVVGLRLGCLNHALLTARAIDAAGLELAGWIANAIDPRMAVREENIEALERRLRAPLLARFPFDKRASAARLAPLIDVDPLLGRATKRRR
jgi:dethiobiotin synthetase